MTLGYKIAQYRKNLNITQDALAQQLGVTNQAVSKWESDQCCPDVMLLPKLADIFSITIDTLFGRETQPKDEQATTPVSPFPDDNVLRVAVYVGSKMVCGSQPDKDFRFAYDADVDAVLSCVSVSCGNVGNDVNATGSVKCGDVAGHVDAGADIRCGNVSGNVDAGSHVNCGDVGGSVDADSHVKCGNVGGNVDAGSNVECGNVKGSVDAGRTVTIRK